MPGKRHLGKLSIDDKTQTCYDPRELILEVRKMASGKRKTRCPVKSAAFHFLVVSRQGTVLGTPSIPSNSLSDRQSASNTCIEEWG